MLTFVSSVTRFFKQIDICIYSQALQIENTCTFNPQQFHDPSSQAAQKEPARAAARPGRRSLVRFVCENHGQGRGKISVLFFLLEVCGVQCWEQPCEFLCLCRSSLNERGVEFCSFYPQLLLSHRGSHCSLRVPSCEGTVATRDRIRYDTFYQSLLKRGSVQEKANRLALNCKNT